MEELRKIENDLVPVYETSIGEKVVYGTELHKVLGTKSNYREWANRRFKDIDAVENEDFEGVEISTPSGQTRKEHIISLDIAKEMAMMERNEKGKQVRRYFIQLEKKYKEVYRITQIQNEQFLEFMNSQAEFNKKIMETLALLQKPKEEPEPKRQKIVVCDSQFSLSERLRELNSEFSYLSEVYGIERRVVMHRIYKMLDSYLGQEYNLDVWLGAYKDMTGRKEACTIHAVAYFDELYDKAMDMMEDMDKMDGIFNGEV